MGAHDQLRADLEPLIREVGVREVARRADLRAPNISEWLAGDRTFGVDILGRVAQAVGRTIVIRRSR